MKPDSDTSDRRGSHGGVVAALVITPVLYILSVGPAVWLFVHGYLPEAALVVYQPVNWMHDVSPELVQGALERYVEWWGG